MKRLLVVGLGLLAASCGSSRGQTDPQTEKRQSVPSTTEVFHLRSECASLGDKVLKANIIGPALMQSQTSHYDPTTNRCYVELAVNMADLRSFEDFNARYLYDGQTGEMLVSTTSEKGHKRSNIFLPNEAKGDPHAIANEGDLDLFVDANSLIDKFMADDRSRGRK